MPLPRRALVALGLALGLVVSAATPANASWTFSGYNTVVDHYESSVNRGHGSGAVFMDTDTGYKAYIRGEAVKPNTNTTDMQNSCTETWVDQEDIQDHRAPDVFVKCRVGQFYSPILAMGWHTSGGNYGGNLYVGGDLTEIDDHPTVMVCRVDVFGSNKWKRINPEDSGSRCTRSSGTLSVNPFHNRFGWIGSTTPPSGYSGTLQAMGNSNEPQHIRADGIASLPEGESMYGGDLLVSVDGHYSAVMQLDGNFVVIRNSDSAVLWSVSGCLSAGKSLVSGSRIVLQSDGNLVVYSPSNVAVWASANLNSCGGGTFGGTSNHLEMQTDGNLVAYSSGGVLWDRL